MIPAVKAYLVFGKERLLKKEFILELQKKFFPDTSTLSLNYQEFSADHQDIRSFFDFVCTAPFLGTSRMGVFWDIDELENEGKKRLAELLQELPPTAIVVLVSEATSLKKSVFLQSLEKWCTLAACHPPFDRDLPAWIDQRVKKQGKTLDRQGMRALMEYAGKDLAALENAIETLVIYTHPRKEIASQDIFSLLGKTASQDVFLLMDEIFQSNHQAALTRLNGLFRDGARAPELIGVIASQLERMKTAADLTRQGMSPADVAAFLKINSFFHEKFIAQLKKMTYSGIVRFQRKLLECDALVKRGRLEEHLVLEKLILEA